MPRVQCFAPVANRHAEVLILGSMPGEASLRASRYYGHPQNAFWPIMAEVVGFDAALPYTRRLAALKAAKIALWDVLQSCEREGSLDTRIRRSGEVANDFEQFFRTHPRIARVLFNGSRAAECYQRHVLKKGIATGLAYEPPGAPQSSVEIGVRSLFRHSSQFRQNRGTGSRPRHAPRTSERACSRVEWDPPRCPRRPGRTGT
jgi:TDG/mug DNA glycosylase family protein